MLILVSLAVQALYIVLRPRWKDPWWRLACAYAILMAFFGRPLWEGEPGALRVLLPMNLAFNVLIARIESPLVFWPLLAAGNASALYGLQLLQVPVISPWL